MNSIKYKFFSKIGKKVIQTLEFIISIHTPDSAIQNNNEFPWTQTFESNYEALKAEFLTLQDHNIFLDITEISEEQKTVVKKEQWDFFPLYLYGKKIEENTKKCPILNSLLNEIPDYTTVFFSILKPGTKIETHRGAYKGYLRFHYGILVPDNPNCFLKIAEKKINWKNGKSLIFDDTHQHSVENNTDEHRIILYVDFIRPLPFYLKSISRFLTLLIQKSPYVQNAMKKLNHIK